MTHIISRRGILVSGAAIGAACTLGAPMARAQVRQKLTVVVSSATAEAGTATQTSIPFELGFWADESLDVELKYTRGSAIGAQLVMTGQADVVHAGTSVGLMVPVSKGAQMQAFYNMITQNFQMPAVPADSPIKTLADLKGKKLGVIGQARKTDTQPRGSLGKPICRSAMMFLITSLVPPAMVHTQELR